MQPIVGIDAVGLQVLPRRRSHLVVVTEDLDALGGVKNTHDLGIYPRNRRQLARPIGLVVRPSNPRRLV